MSPGAWYPCKSKRIGIIISPACHIDHCICLCFSFFSLFLIFIMIFLSFRLWLFNNVKDFSSLDSPLLRKELQRLCTERAYVLRRLQDCERSMVNHLSMNFVTNDFIKSSYSITLFSALLSLLSLPTSSYFPM